jgi:hypothetical protein
LREEKQAIKKKNGSLPNSFAQSALGGVGIAIAIAATATGPMILFRLLTAPIASIS